MFHRQFWVMKKVLLTYQWKLCLFLTKWRRVQLLNWLHINILLIYEANIAVTVEVMTQKIMRESLQSKSVKNKEHCITLQSNRFENNNKLFMTRVTNSNLNLHFIWNRGAEHCALLQMFGVPNLEEAPCFRGKRENHLVPERPKVGSL